MNSPVRKTACHGASEWCLCPADLISRIWWIHRWEKRRVSDHLCPVRKTACHGASEWRLCPADLFSRIWWIHRWEKRRVTVPVSDVCVLLICSVYALRHMFKPVLLTDSANFAVTQYQHNTMVYCLTNAYTTRCLWQLGVYHVSRDLAVFAGAWLWLSGLACGDQRRLTGNGSI